MIHRIYIGTESLSLTNLQHCLNVLDLKASQKFGGFTRFDVMGGWQDGTKTYHERTVVYEINTDDDVTEFASYAKHLFDQQAVLVVSIAATSKMV